MRNWLDSPPLRGGEYRRASIVMTAASAALLLAATLTGQQGATKDPYQRSAEIYQMKTSALEGPQRGEEIYYYKCWYCHNHYAKTGPLLKDVSKRRSDEAVIAKIRQ